MVRRLQQRSPIGSPNGPNDARGRPRAVRWFARRTISGATLAWRFDTAGWFNRETGFSPAAAVGSALAVRCVCGRGSLAVRSRDCGPRSRPPPSPLVPVRPAAASPGAHRGTTAAPNRNRNRGRPRGGAARGSRACQQCRASHGPVGTADPKPPKVRSYHAYAYWADPDDHRGEEGAGKGRTHARCARRDHAADRQQAA